MSSPTTKYKPLDSKLLPSHNIKVPEHFTAEEWVDLTKVISTVYYNSTS